MTPQTLVRWVHVANNLIAMVLPLFIIVMAWLTQRARKQTLVMYLLLMATPVHEAAERLDHGKREETETKARATIRRDLLQALIFLILFIPITALSYHYKLFWYSWALATVGYAVLFYRALIIRRNFHRAMDFIRSLTLISVRNWPFA